MKFIKPMLPKRESEGGAKKLRALDVGAGIGRITGALLLEICDTVRRRVGPSALAPRH